MFLLQDFPIDPTKRRKLEFFCELLGRNGGDVDAVGEDTVKTILEDFKRVLAQEMKKNVHPPKVLYTILENQFKIKFLSLCIIRDMLCNTIDKPREEFKRPIQKLFDDIIGVLFLRVFQDDTKNISKEIMQLVQQTEASLKKITKAIQTWRWNEDKLSKIITLLKRKPYQKRGTRKEIYYLFFRNWVYLRQIYPNSEEVQNQWVAKFTDIHPTQVSDFLKTIIAIIARLEPCKDKETERQLFNDLVDWLVIHNTEI